MSSAWHDGEENPRLFSGRDRMRNTLKECLYINRNNNP